MEADFRESLYKDHQLKIHEVDGEGDCLFASVSVILYGNEECHRVIRQKVMDYIEVNKLYFKNFINYEMESIEAYILRKRQ